MMRNNLSRKLNKEAQLRVRTYGFVTYAMCPDQTVYMHVFVRFLSFVCCCCFANNHTHNTSWLLVFFIQMIFCPSIIFIVIFRTMVLFIS